MTANEEEWENLPLDSEQEIEWVFNPYRLHKFYPDHHFRVRVIDGKLKLDHQSYQGVKNERKT